MRTLIKGGRVVDPKSGINGNFDIYIEQGTIAEIGVDLDYIADGVDLIDATGKVIIPGLIDMHCHLREPGFEYKENIESGTKSAAVGGFTSIACMPNTNPVIDNAAMAEFIINRAKSTGSVNVFPIGSISKGLKGEELAEIGELKFAGVVAISDDGRPVMKAALMRHALSYASMFGVTVISHCEDLNLLEGGSMNEGAVSTGLGLKGISKSVEEVMIARDIILAENEGVGVHIAHVSTRGGVELIRQAKKRGVNVTCETCPHYFTLTEKEVIGFNTNAKMNPPLRSEDDVEAIKEGLKDGTIDVIATDHAPHHIDDKNVEFENAANGIVGFETALPLSITYLVNTGILSLEELIEKMSINPASILGLNKGSICEGKIADITIIDLNEEFVVDVNSFKSKSHNSPYDGYKLFGKVCYTIVNGKTIVRQSELMV